MILSYVHGASEVALRYQTIGAAFDESAGGFAGRDALIVAHQRIRWSYGELALRVEGLATGLVALGLEPAGRRARP